jgi:hypothetical protein
LKAQSIKTLLKVKAEGTKREALLGKKPGSILFKIIRETQKQQIQALA